MKRFYTAESVTEGHPDKLCDLIADSILDECLKGDPEARVACEVFATKGTVLLAGEITSKYEPDVLAVAEDVVEKVGYQAGEILFDALIHQQSPDIAQGVQNSMESRKQHVAGEEWKMGAGDQGVMTGYACSETKQFLPLPVVLAHRIVRELSACRISEYIRGLLPDGKAQITVECGIVYADSKTYHRSQKGVRKNERETKRNNDDHVDRNQYSGVYCSYYDRTD